MIKLTEQAAAKIKKTMEEAGCSGRAALRITAKDGKLDLRLETFSEKPPEGSEMAGGIPIAMDAAAGPLLAGLEMDYSEGPRGGTFTFKPSAK